LLVQCVKAIAALANQPDFEPRLAGRKWKPGAEEPLEQDGRQATSEGNLPDE
jgi:hypothetical protein